MCGIAHDRSRDSRAARVRPVLRPLVEHIRRRYGMRRRAAPAQLRGVRAFVPRSPGDAWSWRAMCGRRVRVPEIRKREVASGGDEPMIACIARTRNDERTRTLCGRAAEPVRVCVRGPEARPAVRGA